MKEQPQGVPDEEEGAQGAPDENEGAQEAPPQNEQDEEQEEQEDQEASLMVDEAPPAHHHNLRGNPINYDHQFAHQFTQLAGIIAKGPRSDTAIDLQNHIMVVGLVFNQMGAGGSKTIQKPGHHRRM